MTGDVTAQLQAAVMAAADRQTPLEIRGGGSKHFLGRPRSGDVLELSDHSGILGYDPAELVIRVRGGTPLAEVEAALAAEGQMLGFEPPRFDGATVGGTVAAGLSGPRRPFAGSARDFVLGVTLLTGAGAVQAFGGQVMKNVAGYDVSRLIAGSMGTLGVILDVSLKVLPVPPREQTAVVACSAQDGVERVRGWLKRAHAITATAWVNGELAVRVAGDLLPDGCEPADDRWDAIRDLEVLPEGGPVTKISLPPASHPDTEGLAMIEWGGARRWYTREVDTMRVAVTEAGGEASAWRGSSDAPFTPRTGVPARIQAGLKALFDPAGILNPGRIA